MIETGRSERRNGRTAGPRGPRGRRGQAHTLEAVTAAMLLVASVAFALQVTAVTPLSASTSSQHIENQQQAVVSGVLATSVDNGTLRPTVLFVNNSTGQFHGTGENGKYALGGPPTPFGETLNRTFLDRGIAFNLNVQYIVGNDERRVRQVVYTGAPSDNAVSATRTITLYDDDTLYEPNPDDAGGPPAATSNTLASVDADDEDGFYAPDVHSGPLFNVIVVEVVVWRM